MVSFRFLSTMLLDAYVNLAVQAFYFIVDKTKIYCSIYISQEVVRRNQVFKTQKLYLALIGSILLYIHKKSLPVLFYHKTGSDRTFVYSLKLSPDR